MTNLCRMIIGLCSQPPVTGLAGVVLTSLLTQSVATQCMVVLLAETGQSLALTRAVIVQLAQPVRLWADVVVGLRQPV